MGENVTLLVDGKSHTITVDDPEMPLIYALRDELGLNNPRFGCGLAQCGACTVHVDGDPVRSCITPVAFVGGRRITTLAGLGTPEKPHPLQTAWIAEQVNQCGYCISGWIMTGAALLDRNPHPSDEQIRDAFAESDLPLWHPQCRRQGSQACQRTGRWRQAMTANAATAVTRRAFLSASGALVVALAAPETFADYDRIDRSIVRPDQLSSYISIDRDGTVIAHYGKIDGGQGLESAVAQLVAEEIDVPWEMVRVVMGDTGLTVDMGGSTAGNGIRQGGIIMRQTAAEARRLLIEMAGEQLGLSPDGLTVTDGVVHSIGSPERRISYAELIKGHDLDAPVVWRGLAQQLTIKVEAPLKKPSQFKIIGKPMPRRDIGGKVFGTLQQCSDVRLPGMLHARTIRPAVAGAVPIKVAENSIAHIPGAEVVWIKDFLAVVAEKEWNAVKAAQALKVVWSRLEAGLPWPREAVRSHSTSSGGRALVRSRDGRCRRTPRRWVARGRVQAGRHHPGSRVRISDPVPCQHGAGLRGRGRTTRSRHRVDQHSEAA